MPMSSTKKLGKDFNFCRNTGTFGAPTFPIAANCKDVKLSIEPSGKFDSSDRSLAANTVIPTRYKVGVDFNALWDGGTFLTAIRTAFLAGTSILGAVLDGTTAARGIHGEWCVTAFPIDAPLKDGQPIKINLQPHGNYTNAMVFVSAQATTGTDAVGTKKLGTAAVCWDGSAAVTAMQDIKFSLAPGGLIDSSDRSMLFDSVIPTRAKYAAEGNLIWDPSNAQCLAFWTAFIANGVWNGGFFDGVHTTGAWGLLGDWAVTAFPIDGQLLAGQQVKLTFEPHGNFTTGVAPVTL
jgi:hypothetical protein